MASAQEHGKILIQKYNQGAKTRAVLLEGNTRKLGYVAPASHSNPQEQDFPVNWLEGRVGIDEKERLEVWFKSEAADIIESEESQLQLDVTVIDKKTGREVPSTLSFEDFTGFTVGGTVDITCAAGAETQVAYYEVPTGQQIALGRRDGKGKIYAYLGDDTA